MFDDYHDSARTCAVVPFVGKRTRTKVPPVRADGMGYCSTDATNPVRKKLAGSWLKEDEIVRDSVALLGSVPPTTGGGVHEDK